ncbi:MAG: hypothetical protein ACTIIY_08385 [Lacticaseibacillus paracasei]
MTVESGYKGISEDLLYVFNRVKENIDSNCLNENEKVDQVKLSLIDISVKDTDGQLKSVSELIDKLLNGQF